MEDTNLDYLSGEVKEILGNTPRWVGTWALGGILLILTVLAVAGLSFKFTDVVGGEIVLTTQVPPVPVQSPQAGYLAKLLVKEGDSVGKDEVLAIFSNDADLNDVLQLEKELDSLDQFDLENLRNYEPDRDLQLGDLASSYENFLSVFDYVPLSGTSRADQSTIVVLQQLNSQLQRSITSLQTSNLQVRKEIDALETEFRSIKEKYDRERDEKMTPAYWESNRKINEKLATITTNEVQVQRNKDQIETNNARMKEIERQSDTGLTDKIFQLKQSQTTLKNAIRRWRSQNLVLAPSAGKVSFFENLTPNQFVPKDEPLLVISPSSAGEKYLGQMNIPKEKIGGVKVGQPVQVKLLRYPFREFGTVAGTVSQISALPKGDAYAAEISMENGLKTSTGQTLEFYQQMSGIAEIETDEQLFIGRIFSKLF